VRACSQADCLCRCDRTHAPLPRGTLRASPPAWSCHVCSEHALAAELDSLEAARHDAEARRADEGAAHQAALGEVEEAHAALRQGADQLRAELGEAREEVGSLGGQLSSARAELDELRAALASAVAEGAALRETAAAAEAAAADATRKHDAMRRVLGTQLSRQVASLSRIASHLSSAEVQPATAGVAR
jgi:chromosome segregation ATPase